MIKKCLSVLMMLCLVGCASLAPAAESRAEEGVGLKITVIEDTEEEEEEEEEADGLSPFADIDGMDFSFSSGAGAWSTDLVVNADGSFTGFYHDSNMGDSDPAYPGGTVEISEFSGQFSEPEQVNDYTWSFSIESLVPTYPDNTYEIRDQVRYHYCEPYGLEEGDACQLYLPGTAVSLLSEDFVDWIYGLWQQDTLPYYGLYDMTFESGWRGYDDL